MTTPLPPQQKLLQEAHLALQKGDKRAARRLAEQAAQAAPNEEEAWLFLASLAAPRASAGYARRALQSNPNSPRAQKALQWANSRLQQQPPADPAPTPAPRPAPARPPVKTNPTRRTKPDRTALYAAAVFGFFVLCAAASLVFLWATTPASAQAPAGPAWASVELQKAAQALATDQPTATLPPSPTASPQPSPTASASPSASPSATLTATALPSQTAQPSPTDSPTATFTAAATAGASPTALPTDTPAPTPVLPTSVPPAPVTEAGTGGERWIDVNLTQQMVYAYEGDTLLNSFLVSTGTWQYPTVTGQYRIYIKYRTKDMSGPDYYLPDVPYTMFFYQGYAFHGTYWHSNFGTPMSHGCVNLATPDAAWLYNFASVGTLVNVHY